MISIVSLAVAKHPRAAASDPFVQNSRDYVLDYHIAVINVRRLELSSVAVFLFMLSGCCKPFDSPTKQENEAARAWVTASWRGQYDWTRIAQWKVVTESRILRAETLLRSIAGRSNNDRGGPGTSWRIQPTKGKGNTLPFTGSRRC